MKTSVIGYPRIGNLRELKFASESFFAGKISESELQDTAKKIRLYNLNLQKNSGIDFIPSNDFSFYDGVLDTAFLINAVPKAYLENDLSPLQKYFAAARGYQNNGTDVKALPMKKWYNTNYHYIVPEISDDTDIKLAGSKPFDLYTEAKENGIETKPVIVGPYTFLKLAVYTGKKTAFDFAEKFADVYIEILEKFNTLGAKWIQIDEPSLVMDMSNDDKKLFTDLYKKILAKKANVKVLLQTYFGDVRDIYNDLLKLDFDGIGLDFNEGVKTLELVEENEFPDDKILFAGILNGKNIWRDDFSKSINILNKIKKHAKNIVLGTSCSLLHVPCTVKNETKLDAKYLKALSFAEEKLGELVTLAKIAESADPENEKEFIENKALHDEALKGRTDKSVQDRIKSLKDSDFTRLPEFDEREKIQKKEFNLPVLPTTTIGSFPQTKDVRETRKKFKNGEITKEEYDSFMENKIKECIEIQEKIGLDVLVHGEFERNDMVEYFGQNLNGYIFTEKAWVQSYGTRCVKPPIIWGDVSGKGEITVRWSKYAQSLSKKLVKGMLTGPVTILNWSFPREDISRKESTLQIALAIRDEVLALEKAGIKIIQIDEAALREKLPLRKTDWYSEYLDWAIPAFRLVHSGVQPTTQIHTHMCYSEFTDIIPAIDNMDADVITFEASRSDLKILDSLKENNFRTEVGPGVYDIHSPRVPSEDEIKDTISRILEKVNKDKVWINPDCGLKTRNWKEVVPSLENLVKAAKSFR